MAWLPSSLFFIPFNNAFNKIIKSQLTIVFVTNLEQGQRVSCACKAKKEEIYDLMILLSTENEVVGKEFRPFKKSSFDVIKGKKKLEKAKPEISGFLSR
ncbi:CLUMA_CG018557, isoform A [Clunio marinus]|uniref:CLUMA_CG018557, isoform A n=1 Tax=Clunio marinus TaxID=568069 RepID=A0A1J1IXK9_9DIPT|nr:CLUMA_CG018557, isoform A [Clunio marinus]